MALIKFTLEIDDGQDLDLLSEAVCYDKNNPFIGEDTKENKIKYFTVRCQEWLNHRLDGLKQTKIRRALKDNLPPPNITLPTPTIVKETR